MNQRIPSLQTKNLFLASLTYSDNELWKTCVLIHVPGKLQPFAVSNHNLGSGVDKQI